MVKFKSKLLFIVGIILGTLSAIIFENYSSNKSNKLQKITAKEHEIPWDSLRYSHIKYKTKADYLFNKVTVRCLVLADGAKKLAAAKDTWARGCNDIAVANYTKGTRNGIFPNKREKESSKWMILCKALLNIDPSQQLWLLIVKDTTFVIMENLRHYLEQFNASQPHYLGHTLSFWGVNYNTEEAGYVLSRNAFESLQKRLKSKTCAAFDYRSKEHFYLGKELRSLNITPIDTSDSEGFTRFFPYNWYQIFSPLLWHHKNSVYKTKCCSNDVISFQAVERDKIYSFYYILYVLQRFSSGNLGNRPFVRFQSDDYIWKGFLKEYNITHDVSSEEYYKLWEKHIENSPFARHMKREYHSLSYD